MSITDHAEALAKAVHAALRGDAGVQADLGAEPRLYDSAPEDPIFPYLTYGAMRSEDIGADGTPLGLHQMTLHIWSRYSGRAEVLTLLSRVSNALRAEVFPAVGPVTVRSATPIYSDVLRAADGRTHHGLLRLSFVTETGEPT